MEWDNINYVIGMILRFIDKRYNEDNKTSVLKVFTKGFVCLYWSFLHIYIEQANIGNNSINQLTLK